MDRVVVRRATPDDYDAIVRLSEGLYEGYDYVPDIYFKCLEDPNRYMQVAEWNGKVVSMRTNTRRHIYIHACNETNAPIQKCNAFTRIGCVHTPSKGYTHMCTTHDA